MTEIIIVYNQHVLINVGNVNSRILLCVLLVAILQEFRVPIVLVLQDFMMMVQVLIVKLVIINVVLVFLILSVQHVLIHQETLQIIVAANLCFTKILEEIKQNVYHVVINAQLVTNQTVLALLVLVIPEIILMGVNVNPDIMKVQ